MDIWHYFHDYFSEAGMIFRPDSYFEFIFVHNQDQPVGYLTSNSGVQAFALFAFDSLHRYEGADTLYLGLFHCHSDATQFFVDHFKIEPIYRSCLSLGIVK